LLTAHPFDLAPTLGQRKKEADHDRFEQPG
jgi:hypothetical protein